MFYVVEEKTLTQTCTVHTDPTMIGKTRTVVVTRLIRGFRTNLKAQAWISRHKWEYKGKLYSMKSYNKFDLLNYKVVS